MALNLKVVEFNLPILIAVLNMDLIEGLIKTFLITLVVCLLVTVVFLVALGWISKTVGL